MPASDAGWLRRDLTVAFGLAGGHALLFIAAFSAWGWPMAYLAPAPLAALALSRVPVRTALTASGVCQFAMWLWIQRWMFTVTAAGYPLLCLYLAAYGALFVWLCRLASRRIRWPAALLAPPIWIGVEFLRGEVAFDGYPWYVISQPVAALPAVVQSADLLGGYFAGFVAAMVAGLAVDVARRTSLRLALGATAAVQVANLLYGLWQAGHSPSNGPKVTVLSVQTNLAQDNKVGWPEERQPADVAEFIELTRRGLAAAEAARHPVDLIAWPETMLPGMGLEPQALAALEARGVTAPVDFVRQVESLSRQAGAPMLVGSASFMGLRAEEDRWHWDEHYNSAYLVDGRPPYQRYDKYFLTPFGETMPYISKWPWLQDKLLALGAGGMQFDLDAAAGVRLFDMTARDGRALRLGTPICFEDTSGRVCRRMQRADLLINLSNDGWFAGYDAPRRLHGQIARLRCIEERVPIARCANTGWSVAYDSSGRVVEPIVSSAGSGYPPLRQPGWVVVELSLDPRSTLYGRVGDLWGWACLLVTLAWGAWGARTWGARRA